MIIDIINEIQLVEGFVGSIFMPLFIYIFQYKEGLNLIFSTMFAFFFTWIARKIAVNNYNKYNKTKYMYHIKL